MTIGPASLLGTWTAGGQSTQQFLEALFRGGPAAAPALLFDSTVGNSAAGLTGLEFKLRGPNVTVSHKEASGLGALVGAVDLRAGGTRRRRHRRWCGRDCTKRSSSRTIAFGDVA